MIEQLGWGGVGWGGKTYPTFGYSVLLYARNMPDFCFSVPRLLGDRQAGGVMSCQSEGLSH